jgi:glycogen operon protein
MLSQGVPMISGGDELSRTQHGSNNAYCQDNEISWTDWTLTGRRRAFLDFCRRAVQLMRTQPVLRRRRFLQGRPLRDVAAKDIMWLAPSGQEMSDAEWSADHVKCLGVRLSGDAIDEVYEDGAPVHGDTLLYLMNASDGSIPFILPSFVVRPRWETILETFDDRRVGEIRDGGLPYPLAAHSLAVMRLHSHGADQKP